MSSRLKNILTNPPGIGLVALHWLIAFSALIYVPVDNFSRAPESSKAALLVIVSLLILDIPAVMPVALLFAPFYLLGASGEAFFLFVLLVAFFSITFQWLMIGRAIYNFFWRTEPEVEILGIAGNTPAQSLDSTAETELK